MEIIAILTIGITILIVLIFLALVIKYNKLSNGN